MRSRVPILLIGQVESNDVRVAMRQSARAANLATRASFNHEMLAMLYFPDEHKWAVYTPLFGPIGETKYSCASLAMQVHDVG